LYEDEIGSFLTRFGVPVGANLFPHFRTTQGDPKMLVLSRKKNESIVINDDITIVVVEIRGDKVRLGIEAPKKVPVHRREVFDAIRRSEAEAAASPTTPTSPSASADAS